VISRRALFATGAGIVALAGAAIYGDHTHKLDDLARTIGLEPRRLPADSDMALIKRAQADQTRLLLWTKAVAARQSGLAKMLAPLIANTEAQLADLGGVAANVRVGTPPAMNTAALDSVIVQHERATAKRSKESLEAVSGDFAQVLASISVGLSQSLIVLRNGRKALT